MLSTMETRKNEEQKQLVESIHRPAEMLDSMKEQWEKIMADQTQTMRNLVNTTVQSALENELDKKSSKDAALHA